MADPQAIAAQRKRFEDARQAAEINEFYGAGSSRDRERAATEGAILQAMLADQGGPDEAAQ